MSGKVLRLDPIPAANDPALMIRLIVAVAAGDRDPQLLAGSLAVSLPALTSYLDGGAWLGLLAQGGEPSLTPRGLVLASADPRRRRRLLAQAIWHTPDAAEILRGAGNLLAPSRVATWLRDHHPGLSPERERRLSEAAASLLAVALEFPGERRTRADQLALPFQRPPQDATLPATPEASGPEERVAEALLDLGELPLQRISALLGGPPGAVVDALIRQGRAERLGELLVGTRALAGAGAGRLPESAAPFLEQLGTPGLGVAFPSTLARLRDGLSGVNDALRLGRSGEGRRAPSAVDACVRVHGGLLHPGERVPHTVPDGLSLRLRALNQTPAFALLAAFLLVERRTEGRLALRADGSALRWRRALVGTLTESLVGLAQAQGWTVFLPHPPLLSDEALVEAALALGIARRAERRLVLDEALFVRLRDDIEASLTLEALEPLIEAATRWLEEQRRRSPE